MSGYFDNSATTFVCPAAKAAIINALENINGNASSLHTLGLQAETAVRQARKQLAKSLGAGEEEIFFTSGGTESNNTAVFGSIGRLKRRGNALVTTKVEHASVLESVKAAAERENLQAVFIAPNPDASLDLDAFSRQLNEKTIFVSAMLCNNETGAIHDIPALARLVRQKAPLAYFHCDAVGAFGKMPINVKRLDVDLLSVSAHKIGGPKGIGALYVKKGVRPLPLLVGGRQQQGLRPGTESVPLIAGFGAAIGQLEKLEENLHYIQRLRNLFIQQIQSQPGFTLHLPAQGSPYVVNLSTNKVRSEIMLHFLEEKGLYVSSGSACGKGEKSHVLKALGASDLEIDTALRISFCPQNTEQDVLFLVQQLQEGCQKLRHR